MQPEPDPYRARNDESAHTVGDRDEHRVVGTVREGVPNEYASIFRNGNVATDDAPRGRREEQHLQEVGEEASVRVSDTFRGTVIDVKYGEADDEAARPLLEAIPFRWSRFSKYCAAFETR